MKTFLLLITGMCLFVNSFIAQTPNHPVIEKVQVNYKPVRTLSASGTSTAVPVITVNGTTSVTLKTDSNVVKIYLKIKDKQTQTIIYHVHYLTSQADVIADHVILYKKQNHMISITNPANIPLKPYVYELCTEDAAGNKSSVYSIIQ